MEKEYLRRLKHNSIRLKMFAQSKYTWDWSKLFGRSSSLLANNAKTLLPNDLRMYFQGIKFTGNAESGFTPDKAPQLLGIHKVNSRGVLLLKDAGVLPRTRRTCRAAAAICGRRVFHWDHLSFDSADPFTLQQFCRGSSLPGISFEASLQEIDTILGQLIPRR